MRTYWATKPGDEIGSEVDERARKFRMHVTSSGRFALWSRSLMTYFGYGADGSYRRSDAVTFSGEAGERINLMINLSRTLSRAANVLATGSKPTYSARPRAYDASTTELVEIGNAIFDQAMEKGGVSQALIDGMEIQDVMGDAVIAVLWDSQMGDVIGTDPQTGALMRDGDVRVEMFRADQVIRDTGVTNGEHDWIILARTYNRWSLAAQYPAWADTIVNAPSGDLTDSAFSLRWEMNPKNIDSDSDQIVAYEFYHRATAALPQGRACIVVGGDAISDGPNPYEGKLPIAWVMAYRDVGTAFGYPSMRDTIALQTALDACISQAVTIQENYGMPVFAVQAGQQVDVEIAQGTKLVTSASVPTPADRQGNGAAAAIAMGQFIQSMMLALRSMNETSIGAGSTSASGASIAQQQQQTIANNGGVIGTYLRAFGEVMTMYLERMQRFATTERVVHVVGQNNASKVVRFKGETLQALGGIDVEMGSGGMRASQMRHQIMTDLLKAGLISDPEVALQMFSTGRLEPAFDGPRANEACIERENVELQAMRPVLVMQQDMHADHIKRHGKLLADPEVRANPQMVQHVMQHLYEHAATWSSMTMDPVGMSILAATGQQPSPSAAMQMQAKAAAGVPPGADPNAAPTQNPDVRSGGTGEPVNAGPASMPAQPDEAQPIETNY